MKLYYSICYLSKASEALSPADLQELFEYSADENTKCKVTGILLQGAGNFFQVLEGNEDHLKSLFQKIKKDDRHSNIFEIFNGKTAHPIFHKYNSVFNVVKTTDDLNSINEFLSTNRSHPVSDKLQRLLQPFLFMGDV